MDSFAARGILLGIQSPGPLIRSFIAVFVPVIHILWRYMPIPKMAAVDNLPRDELKCYIKSICGRWIGKEEVFETDKSN
jgi:hypothetical protein